MTAASTVSITTSANKSATDNTYYTMQAPNTGSYLRTNKSVTIYTESGHCKGTYVVYLHQSRKYIDFNNTWICIQGKQRFGYNGNWYVIKWN